MTEFFAKGTRAVLYDQTVIVSLGDTLATIAARIGLSHWEVLAEYNGISNPDIIEANYALAYPALTLYTAREFRFPLEKTDTRYLKFGTLYGAGPFKGLPHPGVDFHEHDGAMVVAVGDGTVYRVHSDPAGYGNYVMLSHDTPNGTIWTLYAHLNNAIVSEGGEVCRGQVIGFEGASGAGAGGVPHLHFEVKRTPGLGLYKALRQNPDKLTDLFADPYVFLSSRVFWHKEAVMLP